MTEGYTITNTFEVPGDTINVPIVKVWDDNNNNAGKRPESIIVRIQGDTNTEQAGNEINKTETINTSNVVQGNANNWAYTFTGLPKYNELGNEVEYKSNRRKNRRNIRNILYSRKYTNNRRHKTRLHNNKYI